MRWKSSSSFGLLRWNRRGFEVQRVRGMGAARVEAIRVPKINALAAWVLLLSEAEAGAPDVPPSTALGRVSGLHQQRRSECEEGGDKGYNLFRCYLLSIFPAMRMAVSLPTAEKMHVSIIAV